jgi:CDP-diacylglycerol---serine O-phosphatidyltransferase
MKKQIPNIITLVNLFCGCLAIVFMFENNYTAMLVAVIVAEFADLMDGFAARLLKSNSTIGKDLDSLADMVTFGVLPGIALFQMLEMAEVARPYAYLAFILTAFSCLRLAIYNNDTREGDNFYGLPTPSTAAFVLGLILIVDNQTFGLQNIILQPIFLFSILALFSWLMLTSYPMFNLLLWGGRAMKFVIFLFSSVLP